MDLGFLSHLYAVQGPFATAYIDCGMPSEDMAQRLELGWRALRTELTEGGADEATLVAMDTACTGETTGAPGRCLIGAQGRVLLDLELPRAPLRETATVDALPHVMPLVAILGEQIPYVLVVADRTGADIEVHGDLGRLELEVEITGDDNVIRKVQPGGWSQRRFQQRAEDSWDKNAGLIADRVTRLVEAVDACIVITAGDVRTRAYLREHLPATVTDLLVDIDEGGRAAGSSIEALRQRVEQLVAEAAVRRQLAAMAKFDEERGQQDRAVEGLTHTVEALQKAQVDTLVLRDDPSSDLTLWIGPEPLHIACSRADLAAMGVDEGVCEVRADAAVVRALVGSAAGLVVTPDAGMAVPDGIGAVLRYTDASTLAST
jgi:hypothetical protein